MSCPTCGTDTKRARAGHPSLCLRCSEAEIGETYVELRERVNAKIAKSAKKKWRMGV